MWPASIASRANIRDDREAPLLQGGTGETMVVICPTAQLQQAAT
jgi:hypothetical protein